MAYSSVMMAGAAGIWCGLKDFTRINDVYVSLVDGFGFDDEEIFKFSIMLV